jgi:hypothetical protein
LIRVSHALATARRAAQPGRASAIGAVALAAVVAVAGCGSGSAGSSGSGSSQNSAFRQCLEKHGVTPPSGRLPFAGGSGGTPRPRPTGSGGPAFRQAIQACRGSLGGFPGPAG